MIRERKRYNLATFKQVSYVAAMKRQVSNFYKTSKKKKPKLPAVTDYSSKATVIFVMIELEKIIKSLGIAQHGQKGFKEKKPNYGIIGKKTRPKIILRKKESVC